MSFGGKLKLKPVIKYGWFTVTHILIVNLNDEYVQEDWVKDIVKELQKKFNFFSVKEAENVILKETGKKTAAIYIFAQAYNPKELNKNGEQCLFLAEGDFSKDKLGSYEMIIAGLYRDDGKHYALYLEYVQVGNWRILNNIAGRMDVIDNAWPTINPVMNDNSTIRMEYCYPLHGPGDSMQTSTDGIGVTAGYEIDFCSKGDRTFLYAKSHAVTFIQGVNLYKKEPVTIGYCRQFKSGNNDEAGYYMWLMYLGRAN